MPRVYCRLNVSVSMNFLKIIARVAVLLPLSSCNGILDDIYDEPTADTEKIYGFVASDDASCSGRIYIDAREYTEWHYVSFVEKSVTTVDVGEEAHAMWDFAIHRYDAKTNGGVVAATSCSDFAAITAVPDENFTGDLFTTEQIAVDMSGMMTEVGIIYAEDYYNSVLSQWLDVDTSQMPPIYTLSGMIYLLRLSDGTYAALKLCNFMNDDGLKGYMTIDYLYPVSL